MNTNISEEIWAQILCFLKSRKGLHTKDENKLRKFMEGVWYVLRTGCQWRLLPSVYGHWRALHQRYKTWSDNGVWEALMLSVREIDDQEVMLDSTIVKAHACASGYQKGGNNDQALGRSKGGFTTRIHVLADALGNPIKFRLTPGQRNDITEAEVLLEDIHHTTILADKGYDCIGFIKRMEAKACTVTIPSRKCQKSLRQIDRHRYKERHLIENLFSKLKQFRRVFSRFDKTISSYLGFIHFSGALIWMR